jgi:TonB family protein
MRKLTVYLFVAALTFAVGAIASTLLSGVFSTPTKKSNDAATVTQTTPPTAPMLVDTTRPGRCACSESYVESESAAGEAMSKEPIRGGVLNGKAISLPQPSYPPIARAARASGTVLVQIVVDERGCIQTARAASGHPLLQAAAVQAAQQACFTPTRLSGQRVKVSGVITYNFLLQ